ncbi:MAG TPA: hypothetical protein VFO93_06160 [Hymenobacter sp.]|uniref:hypothetical protein n=1 Tax=Hymenobacter sp. TaxID=1898978 RepID=UPI002D7E3EDC|nr:hypothetical protein [Hymenobacter sp.]HET9503103.1 hypothetical protein [Hymenobacter sp.]
MEIPVSYVVNDANRRQAVQVSYADWKQLTQRLQDAEMQFWVIQELEGQIRKADLTAALAEIREIESGYRPGKTVAEAFSEASVNEVSPPIRVAILATDLFCRNAEPLLKKYPLLRQYLLELPQQKLGGSAVRVGEEHLSIGWVFARAKKKNQPAMRIEVHFICEYPTDTPRMAPLYLAAIYDKSERKLIEPPFTQFI